MTKCGRLGCDRPGTAVPTLLVWIPDYDGPPAELTASMLRICSEHQADTTPTHITDALTWDQIDARLGFSLDRRRSELRWSKIQ